MKLYRSWKKKATVLLAVALLLALALSTALTAYAKGASPVKTLGMIETKGREAVKDFSLEIEDKEFIIFVGPSGAGKSTTLRMIAGLEDIDEGALQWSGFNAAGKSTLLKHLADLYDGAKAGGAAK